MIQRIQTLYLLLVTLFMAVTLFAPLASFADYNVQLELTAFALRDAGGVTVQSTAYLGALLALSCALPFVTIFLFRNRLLQIRLCVAEMVLLVGSAVVEGVYYYLSNRAFEALEHPVGSVIAGVKPAIALPLVALFFAYLAVRAIFRDEMMVRAADRIR